MFHVFLCVSLSLIGLWGKGHTSRGMYNALKELSLTYYDVNKTIFQFPLFSYIGQGSNLFFNTQYSVNIEPNVTSKSIQKPYRPTSGPQSNQTASSTPNLYCRFAYFFMHD